MNKDYSSPNCNGRSGRVKYLIMHYTGMATGREALLRLCDSRAEMSAHYLIEEDGEVFSLVEENMRAWHAGVSKWENDQDINDLSIGIEIVNSGHSYPGYESLYRAFPDDQMLSVLSLSKDIINRHHIKPWHILGHSDVAPGRKIDPGELFNWKWLSELGVGIYPADDKGQDDVDLEGFLKKLEKFGYNISGKPIDIISAFQRHFRQNNFDGILDRQTASLINDLLAQKIS